MRVEEVGGGGEGEGEEAVVVYTVGKVSEVR